MTKNIYGFAGIVIALIAVSVAIFQDDLRSDPPPVSTQLKEKVLTKGAEIFGIETVKKPEKKHDFVTIVYMSLGLLAIILSVVSFINKEYYRIAGMVGTLGIIAITWEYVVIGVVVAIIVFIIINIMGA